MEFGLLGRKLGHSFSPQLHKALGGYDFGLFEVEPGRLEEFMTRREFKGIHVTIPYKRDVMKYCDSISDISEASGSVNCIVRDAKGRLHGTNTDYFGFRYLAESENIDPQGRKCLILGSGGVSGTVKKALEDMGAAEIFIISRSGDNNYSNIDMHSDAEIIVNTTPVGMYPDNGERVIDPGMFGKCKGIIDLIYNPLKTALVLDAEKQGIKAAGGLKMLVAQAAEGCRLFTGKAVTAKEIGKITGELKRNQENIVLIGMPGCGKTVIGRQLGRITGKAFADIDEEIRKASGRTPSDIILAEGEAVFRDIESDVMADILKEGGRVVSAGGGAVERERNCSLMKQNGTVVYIKRELKELEKKERPLSGKYGVETLYERRNPLYAAWSDIAVSNTGIDKTALAIAETIGYEVKDI